MADKLYQSITSVQNIAKIRWKESPIIYYEFDLLEPGVAYLYPLKTLENRKLKQHWIKDKQNRTVMG